MKMRLPSFFKRVNGQRKAQRSGQERHVQLDGNGQHTQTKESQSYSYVCPPPPYYSSTSTQTPEQIPKPSTHPSAHPPALKTDPIDASKRSWRDVPGMYYSPSLGKLIPFDANKMKLSDPDIWSLTWANKFKDALIWLNDDHVAGFHLFFQHAHLAMSRHFYGSSYGIPLDALVVHKERTFGKTCIWSRSLIPAIIDDELYLYVRHRVFHPGRSPEALHEAFRAESTEEYEPRVLCPCTHTNDLTMKEIGRLLSDPWWVKIGEIALPRKSCGQCLSDWDVTIVSEGTLGWYLEVEAYHRLGNCRDPLDWKWRSFAGLFNRQYKAEKIPKRAELGYAPGAVKERWKKEFPGTVPLSTPTPNDR
ncbi:hypothetical protein PG985_003204 [Apiospora marii]|uniref:uncharacterized protein n=1 Tax=Apiospora marii TaxID=335849 RepID=UPI003131427E